MLLDAFAWGFIAASSLIIGAIVAIRFRISIRTIGLIMAFGSGVLISAVSFDLVAEAIETVPPGSAIWVAIGLLAGCFAFYIGDLAISRMGGGDRKSADGVEKPNSALAIVLGTVLDGIPESIVIGLTIVKGGQVGVSYLIAVFISNLPEAISATSGLVAGGWKPLRILRMWIAITIVSGLASLLGFGLFDAAGGDAVALVLGFAAGGILTMLAETMMPEAFDHARDWVDVATTFGFATAFLIHAVS
jgi:zinc transporter, ZIP family